MVLIVKYERNFPIKLPLNIKESLADFYIRESNVIIEYNGVQHYRPVLFGNSNVSSAKLNFKRQKLRDKQLREYCSKNSIRVIEIDGRKYAFSSLKKYLEGHLNELKSVYDQA